jgi:Zn-dependent peptidase ImmA (M78 family)
MTNNSRDSVHALTHGEIAKLVLDLRRQRENLERQKSHLSVSSEATAAILDEIEDLRARAAALQARAADPKV